MSSNGHVLLIDDDQGTMDLLREVLQKEGYTVHEARTGQEALVQAPAFPFEVVLADPRLPDVDGSEVLWTVPALGGGWNATNLPSAAEVTAQAALTSSAGLNRAR